MAIRIIEFATGFQTDETPGSSLTASTVAVTPSGDLSSTNVQAALVELQGDIDAAEAAHTALAATVSTHTGDISDLQSDVADLDMRLDAAEADIAALEADVATRATNADLLAHTGDTSNPHNVTASQVLPSQTGNGGKVLGTDGDNPSWVNAAVTVTTTEGDIIYRGASADTRLAGNTTTSRKFLRQTGTGSASAAPAWDTLQSGDLPAASISTAGSVTREYTGAFTGTLTGVSGTVTDGIRYNVVGKTAHIQVTALISGTSNATTMTITGLPAAITPARNQVMLCFVLDNGSTSLGRVTINTSGVMSFDRFSAINNITSFTSSGTKGVTQQTFTFSLE